MRLTMYFPIHPEMAPLPILNMYLSINLNISAVLTQF